MFAFTLIILFATVAFAAVACLFDTALRARGILVALRGDIAREKLALRHPLPQHFRASRVLTADLRRAMGGALDPYRAAA